MTPAPEIPPAFFCCVTVTQEQFRKDYEMPFMTDAPTPELPPLPEPYTEQVIEYSGIAVNRVDRFPLFTADQMRAYAALAYAAGAAAEREARAKVCDRYADSASDFVPAANFRNCAAAIRARDKHTLAGSPWESEHIGVFDAAAEARIRTCKP